MFSIMSALPTTIERLPAEFLQRAKRVGVTLGTESSTESYLPFGLSGSRAELGLARGQVNELCVARGCGLATTLALGACAEAQRLGLSLENPHRNSLGNTPGNWCAFIDPTASLYAPGVKSLGVKLERLLVVRPPLESLTAITLRLVRSKVCVLVVVDTAGVPGHPLNVDLGAWIRVVRQMTLALEGSHCSVLLLTDAGARRPMSLPVARRIEAHRPSAQELTLRIVKDRFMAPSQSQTIALPCPTFAEPLRRSA